MTVQSSLFDSPLSGHTLAAVPFSNGGTSKEAAKSIEKDVNRLERIVLLAIRAAGSRGLTCEEAEGVTGLKHTTCSARYTALSKPERALIVKSGEKRKTSSGRRADVYVVPEWGKVKPLIYPFRHTWERSRYVQAWLCTRPTEKVVQKQILEMLARLSIRAFPVDAGAKSDKGRAYGAMMRAGVSRAEIAATLHGKSGASEKGVSDVIGVLRGGRALFVEVKQPEWLEMNRKTGALIQNKSAGKPTDEQLGFLMNMYSQGALVTVAWSTEDVEAILRGIASAATAR